MKYLILITLLLVLSYCQIDEINIDLNNYENYSADECIADEGCVWFAFENIAFGNEYALNKNDKDYDAKLKMRKVINKWVKDIHIKVKGKNKEKYLPEIKQHMELVESIIPYKVHVFTEERPKNVFVIVTDDFRRDIREIYAEKFYKIFGDNRFINDNLELLNNPNTRCFGYISTDRRNYELFFAIVFLPEGERFQHCIEEELTQILGLPNDIQNAKFTEFNDSDITQDLTKLDILLLKILYDSRIKTGMSKEETKRLFPVIYNELTTSKEL